MKGVRRMLALLFTALMATPATADDTEISAAYVLIDVERSLVSTESDIVGWDAACNALGTALTDGAGPWGIGPFQVFRCDSASPEFGKGQGESLWTLNVALKGKGGELTLTLRQADVAGSDQVVTLGKAVAPLALLANAELARRLVGALAVDMPMLMRFKQRPLTDATVQTLALRYPAFTDGDIDDATVVPRPPKSLNLYGLRWDAADKLWRPRIVGSARLSRSALPTDDENGAGRAVYSLESAAAKGLATGPLWAHDSRGAGAGSKAWRASLRSLHAELADAQEKRLSSPLVATAADLLGFIGARYGRQILIGNKLLERTSFIGLLFELRSGPLSGLQYYYDVLPPTTYQETSITDVSVDSSISWTRHVLGYTFRFPFPWLIDRVTLTPKLGLWSLEAKIPGPPDDIGRVEELREFEIDKAISLGVEAGMEVLASRFLLRPWVGVDSGYSPVDDSKRVTSRRVGLDTYLAGPRLGILGSTGRFAFLGFLFVENVSLTSNDVEGVEAVANENGVKLTTARRIEYNAGYAGLGLALSW